MLMNCTVKRTERVSFRTKMQENKSPSVILRLSTLAEKDRTRSPEATYLVVVGLFQLLRSLPVLSFQPKRGREGLVLFVEIALDRPQLHAYLLNLKRFHFCGPAWSFAFVDSDRVETPIAPVHPEPRLQAQDLHHLAFTHCFMGSRPRRFSRMALYSLLFPLCRPHSFGGRSLWVSPALKNRDLYWLLQGLERLEKLLASRDFSSLSSLQQLLFQWRQLQGKFTDLSLTGDFYALLFPLLLLKLAYEHKQSMESLPGFLRKLLMPLGREEAPRFSAPSTLEASVLEGFASLIARFLPFSSDRDWTEETSLGLLLHYPDPGLKKVLLPDQYRQFSRLLRVILEKKLQMDPVNDLFRAYGWKTEENCPLLACTVLLGLMDQELRQENKKNEKNL